MLTGLSIRDVVLIERLELSFGPGLSVLTGETGAGKSILLDALGLALGSRADSGLVRRDAAQASVAATFELPRRHPARAVLDEHGIDDEGSDALVLRRVLSADGRSRAFANDQPVSVGLLRALGEVLIELQGQSEQHGLLNVATHRAALDAFGGLVEDAAALVLLYQAWRKADEELAAFRIDAARAAAEAEDLRHALTEMEALDPKPDEEKKLDELRVMMKNREKLSDALKTAHEALSGPRPMEAALASARRELTRIADKAGGRLDAAIAAIDRAADGVADAVGHVESVGAGIEHDAASLEKLEDRLYALRDLARKNRVTVDDLPRKRVEIETALARIDDRDGEGKKLEARAKDTRAAYDSAARILADRRKEAAARLDEAVTRELAPLKLDSAKFHTRFEPLPAESHGPHGTERIAFEIATNPGAPFGPIGRIASGGELSRLMLALRVALTKAAGAPTLVFDEVDSGIGGAVAAAVGDRLSRLGKEMQVLVVTHSPQVAARGVDHWHIRKAEAKGAVQTAATRLDDKARREEIARMLSGSKVTEEARAAADSLLSAGTRKAAKRA
ncbi:MAG: DNA repair protein RecN [Alphaproteobacteria bacterium]|nr:DNA repair protein RecN [Alphaproteobacteria bacterium]